MQERLLHRAALLGECPLRQLVRAGFREGMNLLYLAFPQALHNEKAWAMRAHIPFQYFFGRRPANRPPAAA